MEHPSVSAILYRFWFLLKKHCPQLSIPDRFHPRINLYYRFSFRIVFCQERILQCVPYIHNAWSFDADGIFLLEEVQLSSRYILIDSAFAVAICGLIVGLLIITLFFKTSFTYNLLSGCFTLLLGSYLIVDTQLILGGKHPTLSYDDSITGAMILYSDLANMFMYTLVRLGE